MEHEPTTLLKDYSNEEKAAYFGALSTVAAIDGKASAEELEYLQLLGEAAELPPNVQQEVAQIAQNPNIINLQRCLDVIKKSQLRFSFVADVISFAKADGQYSPEEQKHIKGIAEYMGIEQEQYSILDQFVNKANDAQQHGEDPTSQSFLNKNGFGDMFRKAGISPQMVQGMLGVIAPMVIAGMMLAFEDMMKKKIVMPAHFLRETGGKIGDAFEHFSNAAQRLGVYTTQDYIQILTKLVKEWEIENIRGLEESGEKARDFLLALPARLSRIAERIPTPRSDYEFKWIGQR